MSRYIILLLFMIAGHPDGLFFFWFNYVPSPGTAVIVQCTTAMRRNLVVIPFFIHSNKYYYIIIIVHSYFGNTHCGYRHIYMHTYLGLFPPFFFFSSVYIFLILTSARYTVCGTKYITLYKCHCCCQWLCFYPIPLQFYSYFRYFSLTIQYIDGYFEYVLI